jgi:hypothetical protein
MRTWAPLARDIFFMLDPSIPMMAPASDAWTLILAVAEAPKFAGADVAVPVLGDVG